MSENQRFGLASKEECKVYGAIIIRFKWFGIALHWSWWSFLVGLDWRDRDFPELRLGLLGIEFWRQLDPLHGVEDEEWTEVQA